MRRVNEPRTITTGHGLRRDAVGGTDLCSEGEGELGGAGPSTNRSLVVTPSVNGSVDDRWVVVTEMPRFPRRRPASLRAASERPTEWGADEAMIHSGHPRAVASSAAQSTAFDDAAEPS